MLRRRTLRRGHGADAGRSAQHFAGVPAGFEFAEAIVPGPGNLIDYTMRDQALKAVTVVKIKGSC